VGKKSTITELANPVAACYYDRWQLWHEGCAGVTGMVAEATLTALQFGVAGSEGRQQLVALPCQFLSLLYCTL
jgi:hypothetical protein